MTTSPEKAPVDVLIVAVPETSGSALYGMLDVLLAAGNIWQTLVREDSVQAPFRIRIVAPSATAFSCGNGIPVVPDCSVADNPGADIVILPELWLGPDEDIQGRHSDLLAWIRRSYKQGSMLYCPSTLVKTMHFSARL
jgi:transcriptional regulator GlxA family with amidase domain